MTAEYSSKIRIGFYTNNPIMGGSEIYLKNLVEALDRSVFEIFVFLPVYSSLVGQIQNGPGLKVVVLGEFQDSVIDPKDSKKSEITPEPFWKKIFKSFYRSMTPVSMKKMLGFYREAGNLCRILKHYHLDVFHANEHSPCLEASICAAKQAGIPSIVCAVHFIAFEKNQLRWYENIINAKCFRAAHQVLFVSKYSEQLCSDKYPFLRNKSIVLYSSVQPPSVPESAVAEVKGELNIDPKAFNICVPAAFNPYKGHAFLMNALADIARAIPHVCFYFLGDGVTRPEIELLAEDKKVSRFCRFLGFRRDIHVIMSQCDVVLLPSKLDNLPLVLIEAMFLKKPVVASAVGGIMEIIDHGETGILVPYGDVRTLAQSIIDLADNKSLRQNVQEKGLKKAQQFFSHASWIKRLENIYLYGQASHAQQQCD